MYEAISHASRIGTAQLESAVATVSRVATSLGVSQRVAFAAILDNRAPPSSANDGRTARWSARLRIYATDGIVADTDPDRAADESGAETIAGLPAVASWAAELVARFHDVDPGLMLPEFAGRVATARVQLARSGGSAIWNVRYVVNVQTFTARVDLAQAVAAISVQNRAPAA